MKYAALFSGLLLLGITFAIIGTGGLGAQPKTADAASRIKVFSAEKGTYVMSDEVVKSKDEMEKDSHAGTISRVEEKGTSVPSPAIRHQPRSWDLPLCRMRAGPL